MPQDGVGKPAGKAVIKMTIADILRDYEMRRGSFTQLPKRWPLQPLIMHHITYGCLRDYSLDLLPQNRDVVVCFEHVKYEAVLKRKEVKSRQKAGVNIPSHCLVVQVKFLGTNTFLNVGTIGYMDFTDRTIVAECIKEYVEDCFRADLRVIAICSTGKFEIMNILVAMPIRGIKHGDLLSISIRGRGNIIYMFDPPFMLRRLKARFSTHDVIYDYKHSRYVASYDNLVSLTYFPCLRSVLSPTIYDTDCKTTLSAAKMFSKTVALLLEGFYQPFYPGCPSLPEAKGSKVFVLMFDHLCDTFSSVSTERIDNKPLRLPLSMNSQHWEVWEAYIPVLESMRFTKRTTGFLPNFPFGGKDARRKKQRKKHGTDTHEQAPANAEDKSPNSDDEYKPLDDTDSDDELLKFFSTVFSSDERAESALPEYLQEASDHCKKNPELLMSLARAEGLAKEVEKVRERLDAVKSASTHRKLVMNVESMLNTLAVYNAELRITRRSSITYEYISCKFAAELHRISSGFDDTPEFYTAFMGGLIAMTNKLRFLNYNLFQLWIVSIAGMRQLFGDLSKHHCDSLDTKIVNCDSIRIFMEVLRGDYNTDFLTKVEKEAYGVAHDYPVCILSLTQDFNQTIVSSIFGVEENEDDSRRKKIKAVKKRCGSSPTIA